MKVLIMFTSYYFATKTDRLLADVDLPHELIATPPVLDEACGLCLRLEATYLKLAKQLMVDNHISHSGFFSLDGEKLR